MNLYMANCAVCHGAGTGKATNIADGLYQKPPMLATDGVEDDPAGVTYWKIKHGIRLTGMPAFSDTLNDKQIWQLTADTPSGNARTAVSADAPRSITQRQRVLKTRCRV